MTTVTRALSKSGETYQVVDIPLPSAPPASKEAMDEAVGALREAVRYLADGDKFHPELAALEALIYSGAASTLYQLQKIKIGYGHLGRGQSTTRERADAFVWSNALEYAYEALRNPLARKFVPELAVVTLEWLSVERAEAAAAMTPMDDYTLYYELADRLTESTRLGEATANEIAIILNGDILVRNEQRA